MLRLRSVVCLALLVMLSVSPARLVADASGVPATVAIAPVKTSIYVGNVALSMPPFRRDATGYASTYHAKVFPYFFQSEKGKLRIDFPREDLARLARGETVQFQGQAENSDGEPRRIEGRAVPSDGVSGKIKVRVFVTKKIELIFNTTYRFSD